MRRGNETAQALYRKYRFEDVGLRKRYYRDTGEDALLMTVDFARQPDYGRWLAARVESVALTTAD